MNKIKQSSFFFLLLFAMTLFGSLAYGASTPTVTLTAEEVSAQDAVIRVKVDAEEPFFNKSTLFIKLENQNKLKEVSTTYLAELTGDYSDTYRLSDFNITLEPNTTYRCTFTAGKDTVGSAVNYVVFTTPATPSSPAPSAQKEEVISVVAPPTITLFDEKWVTEDNAYIQGEISYSDGHKPSAVGMYLGTSTSNLKSVWRERLPHNKNPFQIWYDIKDEVGITLQSDTTYYYTFYAVVDGETYKGNIQSFHTEKAQACTHPSYDEEGYCTSCGEEFPLRAANTLNAAMVCNKNNAAIHSRPYGAAPITSRGQSGQTFTVKQQAINAYGNLWYQLSDGQWIVSDYLNTIQSKPSAGQIRLIIGGEEVPFGTIRPVIQNGYTLVPVRIVSNAIDKNVDYNDTARTITISDGAKTMKMTLGSKAVTYLSGGKTSTGTLSIAPVILNDSAMLPVRDVVSFFDYGVHWDSSTLTITLTSGKNTAEAETAAYRNPLGEKKLTVTAGFYYSSGSYHGGVDFVASKGTPLYPVQGGEVLFAGQEKRADGSAGMGGNCVLILGNDGYYYYYAHLDSIAFSNLQETSASGKKVFRTIDNNTLIGYTGNSSRNPNMAEHLHLTIAVPKGASLSIPKGSGQNGTGGMEWFGNHQGTTINGVTFLKEKGVL